MVKEYILRVDCIILNLWELCTHCYIHDLWLLVSFKYTSQMICGVGQSVVYSHCKNWCTSSTDRLCVARTVTVGTSLRGCGLETSPETVHIGNQGKFAFGRNKKGKVFRILSKLKKLSKSNDVHAQNVFKRYVTGYSCRWKFALQKVVKLHSFING